jgi:hypothetical protein
MKGKIIFLLSVLLSLGAAPIFAELRDPTMPAELKVNPLQNNNVNMYQVEEIIISPDRRMAVINGQYKFVDDEIFGNRIVAINKNTVQLQGPSGKITLFLLGKPVKHVSVKEGL